MESSGVAFEWIWRCYFFSRVVVLRSELPFSAGLQVLHTGSGGFFLLIRSDQRWRGSSHDALLCRISAGELGFGSHFTGQFSPVMTVSEGFFPSWLLWLNQVGVSRQDDTERTPPLSLCSARCQNLVKVVSLGRCRMIYLWIKVAIRQRVMGCRLDFGGHLHGNGPSWCLSLRTSDLLCNNTDSL